VNVDTAAPTAQDAVEQRSVRCITRSSVGVGQCDTLEENLLGDTTTVPTSTSSVSIQSRVRSSGSIGIAPTCAPAGRQSASRDERAPTRRLFGSSQKKKIARDREMRAAAELTDVDVFRQFEYLEDFKLLVCKSHGYAVRNVKRHLEEQHVETKTVNKAATARLTALEIHDPRAIEVPATPIAPFASFSPPVNGFLCGGEDGKCAFLSTNDQSMSRHWKTSHGSSKGRQRLNHQKEVKLQSFTPFKGRGQCFIVDSGIAA
jgi:hypothetical protein